MVPRLSLASSTSAPLKIPIIIIIILLYIINSNKCSWVVAKRFCGLIVKSGFSVHTPPDCLLEIPFNCKDFMIWNFIC